jgi:hypothetical protein
VCVIGTLAASMPPVSVLWVAGQQPSSPACWAGAMLGWSHAVGLSHSRVACRVGLSRGRRPLHAHPVCCNFLL